ELCGSFRKACEPRLRERHLRRVLRVPIVVARRLEQLPRLDQLAAGGSDLGQRNLGVREPSAARRLCEDVLGLAQRAPSLVEAIASALEVGRSPERAGEPPAVAGAPEDVARFGQPQLGMLVFAGRRVDRSEAGQSEADPASVVQLLADLE